MNPTITAFAFLRSQQPEQKTDYQNFICAPDCPAEVVSAFERLHETLHGGDFPARPVRLSFPVPTASGTYLCQCLCGAVRSPEGRDFLSLCGLAVKASVLEASGVNPVALLYAADFQRIVEEGKAVIERCVPAAVGFGAQADRELVADFCHRLIEPVSTAPASPWPAPADLPTVLSSLFYAYHNVPPAGWYATAFGLEIPHGVALPVPLNISLTAQRTAAKATPVVAAAARAASATTPPVSSPSSSPLSPPAPSAPRPTRQRLLPLEKLANAVRQQKNLDEYWQYRLWHYCQELLSAADECLDLDDNHDFGPLPQHLATVDEQRARLDREILRAYNAPDTRVVAMDLRRELNDWHQKTFLESLNYGKETPHRNGGRGAVAVAAASGEASGIETIPRRRSWLDMVRGQPAWVWLVVIMVLAGIAFAVTLPRATDRPTTSRHANRLTAVR